MPGEVKRDLVVTVIGDTDSLQRALRRGEKSLGRFGKIADTVGQGVGLAIGFQATNAVAGLTRALTTDAIGAAVNWEASWADVRKTVDGTPEELAAIEDAIRDLALEIPTAAEELAAIAATAGQLGIATADILDFTETVALLRETTNLDAPAESLARFINVTGTAVSEVDEIGSVIVALGNNSATTEQELLAMAQRVAAAGQIAGLSEPEILAISAAMSSVGLEAEAGGSAMSRFLAELTAAVRDGGRDLDAFARIAGVSADTLAQRFSSDPTGAIGLVIDGLSRIDTEGGNVFAALESVGLGGLRARDTMLRLAGSGDLLADALALANEQWALNTALQDEADVRFGTTAALIARLNNQWAELQRQLGEQVLPYLRDFLQLLLDNLPQALENAERYGRPFLDLFLEIYGFLLRIPSPISHIVAGIEEIGLIFRGTADVIGGIVEGDWARVWDGASAIGIGALNFLIEGFGLFGNSWDLTVGLFGEGVAIILRALADLLDSARDNLGPVGALADLVGIDLSGGMAAGADALRDAADAAGDFSLGAGDAIQSLRIAHPEIDRTRERLKELGGETRTLTSFADGLTAGLHRVSEAAADAAEEVDDETQAVKDNSLAAQNAAIQALALAGALAIEAAEARGAWEESITLTATYRERIAALQEAVGNTQALIDVLLGEAPAAAMAAAAARNLAASEEDAAGGAGDLADELSSVGPAALRAAAQTIALDAALQLIELRALNLGSGLGDAITTSIFDEAVARARALVVEAGALQTELDGILGAAGFGTFGGGGGERTSVREPTGGGRATEHDDEVRALEDLNRQALITELAFRSMGEGAEDLAHISTVDLRDALTDLIDFQARLAEATAVVTATFTDEAQTLGGLDQRALIAELALRKMGQGSEDLAHILSADLRTALAEAIEFQDLLAVATAQVESQFTAAAGGFLFYEEALADGQRRAEERRLDEVAESLAKEEQLRREAAVAMYGTQGGFVPAAQEASVIAMELERAKRDLDAAADRGSDLSEIQRYDAQITNLTRQLERANAKAERATHEAERERREEQARIAEAMQIGSLRNTPVVAILEGRTAAGERVDALDPNSYDPTSTRNRVLAAAAAARARGEDPLAAGRDLYYGGEGRDASGEDLRRFAQLAVTLEVDGQRLGHVIARTAAIEAGGA